MGAACSSPRVRKRRGGWVVGGSVAVGLLMLAAASLGVGGGLPAVPGAAGGPASWDEGAPGTGYASPAQPASGPASPPPASPLVTPTPTPSTPSLDSGPQGQWIYLSASPGGGTPPYTVVWYSGFFPQCSGDNISMGAGPQLNVSYTLGSRYYCYVANDSGSPQQVSSPVYAALVSVNTALVAGAITPAAVTIDSGNSVTLTSHPGGGTPPYTVSWYASSTGSPSCDLTSAGSGSTLRVSPITNTTYCYSVTDTSAGSPLESPYSSAAAVNVDPALQPGPVTPASPSIDPGQSVVLNAAPSGGTGAGTYKIQWYSGSSSTCSASMTPVGTNATTYTATPAATTNVCYAVTDASYGATPVFSPVDPVKVGSKLTPAPIRPSPVGVDLGQTVTLTLGGATGGIAPYSYAWYTSYYASCAGATQIPGQTGTTFTEIPGLTMYVCYSATDSAVSPVTAFSAGDLVTVNPVLTAGSPSPVTPTLDAGQSLTLTASASGGTAPYSYTWYSGTNSTCAGDTLQIGTGATTSVAPASPTYYCYKVTDASPGTPAQSALSPTDLVTVNVRLLAGSPTPGAPTIDSGQNVTLTANPTGGTPVWSFQWLSGSGSTCATVIPGATQPTYLAVPTTTTTYCYKVTDGSANPPTVTSTPDVVTVQPTLQPGAITPAGPAIDAGQSVTLTAAAVGGKPPYSYQWYSGSSTICASDTTPLGTASTQVVSPLATTDYCYRVSDSLANPANMLSAVDVVTVAPALVAGAIRSNATVIDVGQAAVLTANASGGTLPYSYQWFNGTSSNCSQDTTPVKGTLATVAVHPTLSTYFCYVLKDASKGTPSALQPSPTYRITISPRFVNGNLNPTTPAINLGQSVTLFANVTGGTPPFTYAWFAGQSSGCTNDTRVPNAVGTRLNVSPRQSTYYCLEVNDSSTGTPAGSSFTPADQVVVNVPPGPTLLGLPEEQGLILVGALGAIVALIGFYVYWRGRRRKRGGPATDFL
jgi:hypothetical protein